MDYTNRVFSSVAGRSANTRQDARKTDKGKDNDKDKHEEKTETNKDTKKRKGQIRRQIQRQSQGNEREEHLQVEAIFAWQGKKLAHGRDSTTREGERGLDSLKQDQANRQDAMLHKDEEGRYKV
jgi:hypothetical protein